MLLLYPFRYLTVYFHSTSYNTWFVTLSSFATPQLLLHNPFLVLVFVKLTFKSTLWYIYFSKLSQNIISIIFIPSCKNLVIHKK